MNSDKVAIRKRQAPSTAFKKGNKEHLKAKRKGPVPGQVSLLQHVRLNVDQYLREGGLERFMASFSVQADKEGTWAQKYLASIVLVPNILQEIESALERKRREDKDFMAYRLQKGTGDHAQTILRSRERLQIHMAGRRGGKTDTAARWLIEPLVTVDGARSLYMGLSLAKAMDQIWDLAIRTIELLGFTVEEQSRTDGNIKLSNGSLLQISGNTTIDERNKQRGFWWNRIAIDECQSQKALPYLHDEIFGPTLLDKQGSLMFLGTGPRVRGTYWEELWTDLRSDGAKIGRRALRLNWNISDNPFIRNPGAALEAVRKEHGWEENNSIFIREYLGKIAYDDDALVLRLGAQNYFVDEQLSSWIAEQPVSDIRFTAGLDFGFTDSDALAIICYSTSRPERWLVYEYKQNRIGTEELAGAIRAGIQYVRTSPLFQKIEAYHRESWFIYADTGGNKITPFDLATQYKLPILMVHKQQKEMAIELLQAETRKSVFKCRRGGPFDDEALKTIYARDEADRLTHLIDDETFHPDMIPAVTYGMRDIWDFTPPTEVR